MRKPRRLTPEELAPFQWELPRDRGQRTEDRRQRTDGEQKTENTEQGTAPGGQPPEGAGASQFSAGLSPDLCPLPSALNWAALFGNANPVEVEVGMGKGLFLLTSAVGRPGTNFFGIEIVRKYQLYATSRFALRGLPNVKTACADAGVVFRRFVAEASVAAVHVYFPDPWWKARHKKRRVFTAGFAADVARVLRVGGRLLIATDVEEYFGVMTGIVRAMPAFRELGADTSTASVEEAGYQTNFERKAREKGTPVWRAEFERTSGPVTAATDPDA